MRGPPLDASATAKASATRASGFFGRLQFLLAAVLVLPRRLASPSAVVPSALCRRETLQNRPKFILAKKHLRACKKCR